MSPFQLYIGVEKEVRKFKSDLQLSTADITYFLNKALNEFVDYKYSLFDTSEEAKTDLKGLVETVLIEDPSSITTLNNATLNSFNFTFTNVRFVLSERVQITLENDITKIVGVKPTTIDNLNIELKNPYSPFRLHLNEAKPLRYYDASNAIIVGDYNYTVDNYTCIMLTNPSPFTIDSAMDTTEYYVIPKKSHNELITIAVRQILENSSNQRYQTYNLEEQKSK
jgi:hypothetical protein